MWTIGGTTTRILVKLLLVLVTSQIKDVEADGCKTMDLLPKKAGSYLRNHIIQTLTTESQSICRVMCYLSDSCLSYNFQESTGTCDINDSDEFQHPDDIIARSGYVYVGTENGCQSKSCPTNSTCQANFAYEGGFKCFSPSGFTGPSCNTDIDECTSGTHNCSAKSKCQNIEGSFQCTPLVLGTRDLPGKSCLDILVQGYSNSTGEYWLDPINTGNPIQAFCDMTTDGGGWTKVKKLYLENPAIPLNKIIDTYLVIDEYNNNIESIIPSGKAMLNIKQVMGFHQIHFYCHKESVGRVVSIMTKNNTAGQQVVRYFTDDIFASTTFPDACDSFDRLPDDSSVLAQNCSLWGKDVNKNIRVNKWGWMGYYGSARLVTYPFGIQGSDDYAIGCYKVMHRSVEKCSCDDSFITHSPLNVNDTWQIAVR